MLRDTTTGELVTADNETAPGEMGSEGSYVMRAVGEVRLRVRGHGGTEGCKAGRKNGCVLEPQEKLLGLELPAARVIRIYGARPIVPHRPRPSRTIGISQILSGNSLDSKLLNSIVQWEVSFD